METRREGGMIHFDHLVEMKVFNFFLSPFSNRGFNERPSSFILPRSRWWGSFPDCDTKNDIFATGSSIRGKKYFNGGDWFRKWKEGKSWNSSKCSSFMKRSSTNCFIRLEYDNFFAGYVMVKLNFWWNNFKLIYYSIVKNEKRTNKLKFVVIVDRRKNFHSRIFGFTLAFISLQQMMYTCII